MTMASRPVPRNPYEFTRAEYNELVRKMPQPVVSHRSEYEEIELIEDCTLYDIYRQPRPPVADPGVTRTLPVRVLNADLTCPICLGIIRQTEVVMECLHRFCGECIQKCLRVGKNECPSCRIHIPSKRSLRRDHNFDELIAKIYPDLDDFTEKEDKLIAEINRTRHFNNALTESTKMGVQNQQTMRRNGGKKKLTSEPANSPSSSSSSSSDVASPNTPHGEKRSASWAAAIADAHGLSLNGSSSEAGDSNGQKRARLSTDGTAGTTVNGAAAKSDSSSDGEADKVNLRVLLHPDETESVPRLEKTLFRTSYKLKIRHLKKHLSGLLNLATAENMRIVLSAKNCSLSGLSTATSTTGGGVAIRKDLLFDQELEDYVSLYDIYQQYGMGTKWELQLLYHFSDTIVNGVAQIIANGE